MEDIIVQSFETHGIQRRAVAGYGNVYIYVLVIHMVENKYSNIHTYIENE